MLKVNSIEVFKLSKVNRFNRGKDDLQTKSPKGTDGPSKSIRLVTFANCTKPPFRPLFPILSAHTCREAATVRESRQVQMKKLVCSAIQSKQNTT